MNIFAWKIWNKVLQYFKYIDYTTIWTDFQPTLRDIPNKTVVIVGNKSVKKWAIMKCPCGCNEVLTLSLMKSYTPNWSIEVDKRNRITFSPSIWKSDGCRSHFFLEKGKLVWAKHQYN